MCECRRACPEGPWMGLAPGSDMDPRNKCEDDCRVGGAGGAITVDDVRRPKRVYFASALARRPLSVAAGVIASASRRRPSTAGLPVAQARPTAERKGVV